MRKEPLSGKELSALVDGLNRLARNLWWTWNQESQEIFQELSPRCWQTLYHNAVAVLHEVSNEELRSRLRDPAFQERVRRVLGMFEDYLKAGNTWCQTHAPALAEPSVAYFSAEFGFHETLPIAAGGLGVLAGDHAKSASDLGLGFVGISLFYREGYFMQSINHENWQTEYYTLLNPENLPVESVLDDNGEPLVCDVEIGLNRVFFRAFRANIGRVPVYLLDTDLPENEQHERDLTLRVYGGDTTTRILQEILLGIGGVRLLRALNVQPAVYHMNEGHAAFLTLELIREKLAGGASLDDAIARTRSQCIFTTHTPVAAGHDRFSANLMHFALNRYLDVSHLTLDQVMPLGRVHPNNAEELFCMTVLALRLSRCANAVSELHGQVSRQMWHALYPARPVDQVPIGHITNGVHLLGWMKGTLRRYWRRKLSPHAPVILTPAPPSEESTFWETRPPGRWDDDINTPEFWKRLGDPAFVSDEELWALRYKLRRELIEFARRRLLFHAQRISQRDFIAFDHLLNPDALTIGFGRRFATYKRAPLVFQQFDNIVKLVHDKERPLQFIFAGKAHPRDDSGKRFIQHIIHLSRYSELQGHLVFLENYDVHVARQMVSGCDVWLNNPRRPLEASGTSGMKGSCHGCLNLSILDGWWREGYNGSNGFAIGDDSHPDNIEEQDRRDSENLYRVLTEQVIPCFFDRDDQGIPRKWIQRIRNAMTTLVPQFTTERMVREYIQHYYLA
ncbi:MAG: alpha-glucan family phosphorylase [Verrucomicrobia bacterium]|nr:alpha-glucan family phosphorylase [Verrucomicrobiota bacterium]